MTATTTSAAATLKGELAHYCGGDQPYKHSLNPKFCYTAGTRYFAQKAGDGAYWLLDILATEPKIKQLVTDEGFALVTLSVNSENSAVLRVRSDSDEAPIYYLSVEYTDCPEGDWKFYIEEAHIGGSFVMLMMLPNER